MRSLIVVCVVVAVALPAAADHPKLSAADRTRYAKAMQRGRALEGKHDFTTAITAFEDALNIAPDDPVAPSELGWSAYNAHDLARAESATRAALANQASAAVRGATLYNLGLIEEAKGDRGAAVAANVDSLNARYNATVRAALAKLDAIAASAFEPLRPAAMAGPFKSVDAYCKSLPAPPSDEYTPSKCACGERAGGGAKVAASFTSVSVFVRQCGGRPRGMDDERGALGYYGRNCYTNEQKLTYDARVADVIPGGAPEALVTTQSSGTPTAHST